MTNYNVASEAATQAYIAGAKAEIAIALTEQFQRDINGLRDALEHANHLITTLRTENANLKAALSSAVEGYDFDNLPDAAAEAAAAAAAAAGDGTGTGTGVGAGGGGAGAKGGAGNNNPELLRPPPEGAIFSNGAAYNPSKSERGNTRLKEELNRWTQARGYSVKILRSKLAGSRAKLVVSCVYAGSPRGGIGGQQGPQGPQQGLQGLQTPAPGQQQQQQLGQPQPQHVETAEEERARRERALADGYRFYKKRTSKLRDCPLRFALHEVIQGSGTFVVRHSPAREHQRCNHEPDPLRGADEGATDSILSPE